MPDASGSLSGAREDACAAGDRLLAETWPGEARARASAKMQALGPYGATVAPWLDREKCHGEWLNAAA